MGYAVIGSNESYNITKSKYLVIVMGFEPTTPHLEFASHTTKPQLSVIHLNTIVYIFMKFMIIQENIQVQSIQQGTHLHWNAGGNIIPPYPK